MAYMTVGKDPVRVVIDAEPGAILTIPDNWAVGQPYELTVPTNKKVHVLSMSEAEILKRVGKLNEDSDVKFLVDGYRRLQSELDKIKGDRARELGELDQKFEASKEFWRKKYREAHGDVALEVIDKVVKIEQYSHLPEDPDLYVDSWRRNSEDRENPFEYLTDIEWDDEPYQFDDTQVWVHKPTGRLFFATDSGCSCPSPFEDTQVKDLTEITRPQVFVEHCNSRRGDNPPGWLVDQIAAAHEMVVAAWRGAQAKAAKKKAA